MCRLQCIDVVGWWKQVVRWDGICAVPFAIAQCNCNIKNGDTAQYKSRDNAPEYTHPHVTWSVEWGHSLSFSLSEFFSPTLFQSLSDSTIFPLFTVEYNLKNLLQLAPSAHFFFPIWLLGIFHCPWNLLNVSWFCSDTSQKLPPSMFFCFHHILVAA